MPGSAIPFDSQDYWTERFGQEPSFEWLMSWSVLEPHMQRLNLLSKDPVNANILNLGCGNSDLPLDLYRAGYRNVTSIDFVSSVVDRMRQRCEAAIGWPQSTSTSTDLTTATTATALDAFGTEAAGAAAVGAAARASNIPLSLLPPSDSSSPCSSASSSDKCPLQFLELDCLDMSSLPSNHFQLCIDKSTSDAISCGDDDQSTKIRTLCDQVARVVTQPGGVWCVVSYSRFRQYEWPSGVGAGLWKTEEIVEIIVPPSTPPQSAKDEKEAKAVGGRKRGGRGPTDATRHTVHVPEVFQYLYVNRRV